MWRINPDNQLTEIGDGKTANVVWVASEQAVFYRAELPPNQKQIWAQTVGFVLEDQLMEPVEKLHFAIGTPDDHEGVPVVTLPLREVEAWLAALQEKRIKARHIWPDFLAVPFSRDDAYDAVLWHEQGRCILRLGEQECVTGTMEWIFSLVKMTSFVNEVRIYSDDASTLPEEWHDKVEPLPCSLEERMIQLGRQKLPLNLMQGQICPEPAIAAWLKPWYGTAVTLLFLAGTYLTGMAFEVRALNAQTTVLQKVTERTFLENFPGQERVSNVRIQVSRLLSESAGGEGRKATQLWRIMKKIDPILSACQACRVESIKLKSTSLRLEISSSADFAGVVDRVKQLPQMDVSVENAPDSGERKQIRVEIEAEEEA